MAHPRQNIRHAVTQRLIGHTAAATRVFPTREAPLRRIELPALMVYTLEESIEADSRQTAPRYLSRSLQLAVVGVVQLNDAVDDALDELAVQVEHVMAQDETLGGLAGDCILSSTEIGVDESGNRPVGMARLVYTVTYETPSPDYADAQPADFRTADIRTSLGGAQAPEDQAHDVATVETEP